METVVTYSVKETAAAIRKALRARWPGVKFSLTMSRGTGYGWLDLRWTDGPLQREVDELTSRFQDSYWDGMDDSYHQVEQQDPGVRYSCCGVLSFRRYSPEAEAWAEGVAVRGSYWWPEGVEPYRDNTYMATRGLLAASDLTDGFPSNPKEM